MEVEVTIKAVLTLPEGTTLPEDGRAFTLPGGDWVKPWIILERNDMDDLGFGELVDAGIDVCETEIEWVEV